MSEPKNEEFKEIIANKQALKQWNWDSKTNIKFEILTCKQPDPKQLMIQSCWIFHMNANLDDYLRSLSCLVSLCAFDLMQMNKKHWFLQEDTHSQYSNSCK